MIEELVMGMALSQVTRALNRPLFPIEELTFLICTP